MSMTNRERTMAILNYQPCDRLPVVHFGYWDALLEKWHQEGHLTAEEAAGYVDGNEADRAIAKKLGFDFNWQPTYCPNISLNPPFTPEVLETLPDGSRKLLDANGAIVLDKPDVVASIPVEYDHILKDRESWEAHFLPRLQYHADRQREALLDYAVQAGREDGAPLALHCGSLYGELRNWLGFEGISYLSVDDEDLYTEIIDTVGQLALDVTAQALASGVHFDYGHFWEDICFKNGPMISPRVYEEKVAPWYRKITDLLRAHGIHIISLDCDGVVDLLIPVWLRSGINTMFPIEVGTWHASIAPWREKYGRELRGVGGMNKHVLSGDYADVDKEIERLRPLIELGGYIPCPDHRLPIDTRWETVQYYCDQLRKVPL